MFKAVDKNYTEARGRAVFVWEGTSMLALGEWFSVTVPWISMYIFM